MHVGFDAVRWLGRVRRHGRPPAPAVSGRRRQGYEDSATTWRSSPCAAEEAVLGFSAPERASARSTATSRDPGGSCRSPTRPTGECPPGPIRITRSPTTSGARNTIRRTRGSSFATVSAARSPTSPGARRRAMCRTQRSCAVGAAEPQLRDRVEGRTTRPHRSRREVGQVYAAFARPQEGRARMLGTSPRRLFRASQTCRWPAVLAPTRCATLEPTRPGRRRDSGRRCVARCRFCATRARAPRRPWPRRPGPPHVKSFHRTPRCSSRSRAARFALRARRQHLLRPPRASRRAARGGGRAPEARTAARRRRRAVAEHEVRFRGTLKIVEQRPACGSSVPSERRAVASSVRSAGLRRGCCRRGRAARRTDFRSVLLPKPPLRR